MGSIVLIAAAAGFTTGIILEKHYRQRPLTPEKVLDRVKKSLQDKLPVDGAWIFLSPHDISRNDLTVSAYRGGLTVKDDGSVKHYDFVADAETGSLIDLKVQH
jgi:Predicted small secreted protein